MKKKCAILGCGNMMNAIFHHIEKDKFPIDFYTYTPSGQKAQKLAEDIGGEWVKELSELPQCDYYFIGCKPQQFDDLAKNIKKYLPEKSCIISIMASISIENIKKKLEGKSLEVIRTMPNTPSFVGEGVTLFFPSKNISNSSLDEMIAIFSLISKVVVVESEDLLDKLSGVLGSGPGYIFEIARIFQSRITKFNVSEELAREMVVKLLKGSAALLEGSDESFETLKNNVSCKGGITAEALEYLGNNEFASILDMAMEVALIKTEELKNSL